MSGATMVASLSTMNLGVSGAGDIDARKLDCDAIETHKAGLASIKTK